MFRLLVVTCSSVFVWYLSVSRRLAPPVRALALRIHFTFLFLASIYDRRRSNKIFYGFILVSKYFVTKMISTGLDSRIFVDTHEMRTKHILPLFRYGRLFSIELSWSDKNEKACTNKDIASVFLFIRFVLVNKNGKCCVVLSTQFSHIHRYQSYFMTGNVNHLTFLK